MKLGGVTMNDSGMEDIRDDEELRWREEKKAQAYHWWREALAGHKPAVTSEAQPGWFLAKIDGKLVPGSIWFDGPKDENGQPCGDEELRAEIGGELWHPDDAWPWLAKRPVSHDEYDYWVNRLFEEFV